MASVFLLAMLLQPLLGSLDNRLYDRFSQADHDERYGGDTFLPSLKLLVYSEATVQSLGQWSQADTLELEDFILSSGALAAVFYPGTKGELEPAPRPGVLVASKDQPEHAVAAQRDSDGVCRRVALAVRREGKWVPTVPLRIVALLSRVPEQSLVFSPGRIQVGFRTIATDAQYRILPRFRRSEESLTAAAMAEAERTGREIEQMDPIDLERLSHPDFRGGYARNFRDAVVMVGTGFKEANELVPTPLGSLSDFKVDACAVESVMAGWQLRPLAPGERAIWTALATLLAYLLFSRLPIVGIALAWGALQYGWLQMARFLFSLDIFLAYTPVFLSSSLVALAVALLKYQQASLALRRFGGAGAYEAGLRGDEAVFEEVREKTATIVFTNVLGYLKELERYGSPDEFFEKRQSYAQLLSDVFRKHQGVVLDYQGDFQMVGFNVELRHDDGEHAVHALAASKEFLARLPEVTRSWQLPDGSSGSAHCGICTGPVACGHVGSRRQDGGRIAQAAIGDTSNVAARLLGAAMKQKEPILMAMTTVEAAQGRIAAEPLEPIPLKGKAQAVPVARPGGEGRVS
jgi:class 3 adenylate cyclase